MPLLGSPMVSAAATAFETRCSQQYPIKIVEDELQWRLRPRGSEAASPGPRVIATRWCALEERTREVSTENPSDCHVVGIALRSVNQRLSVSGRATRDGVVMPGTLLVTSPGVSARCIFKGPSDALHLHVPNDLVAECAREMPCRQATSLCSEAAPTRDPMVERLGRALLAAEDLGGSFGRLYVDCIGTAIIARLLDWASRAASSERPKASELVRWRLKRAIDYVEAHLAEPVSLADVASAAGLTRMHFAAQFRAATGLRPHEYLLRRRIERAQEMLIETAMPVVDVALSVGFQTQSHFTSVFKNFVGQPPHAWRLSHGGSSLSCGSATSRVCSKDRSVRLRKSGDDVSPIVIKNPNRSCDVLRARA
jgi:AraC family transcriptional regulator